MTDDSDNVVQTSQPALVRGISYIGERFLAALGLSGLIRTIRNVGAVAFLAYDVVIWIARGLTDKNVRLGHVAIISQVVRLGARAVGIVTLISGCIGLILAFQMEPPLADLGQEDKIANILGVALLRELGPLISAVVMTGFAGAAIAAEIGTMVVGEEIEALEAHALDPIRFLVVPRVIASALALLCLTVFANVVAVGAGMLLTVHVHGVPATVYWMNTLEQCKMADLATGLIKAIVFGSLIGLIACSNGLRVTGGAAGVGRATTGTVVASIVSIIFADLIFTGVFWAMGWV